MGKLRVVEYLKSFLVHGIMASALKEGCFLKMLQKHPRRQLQCFTFAICLKYSCVKQRVSEYKFPLQHRLLIYYMGAPNYMERKYSVESNYGNVEFSRMHTLEKLQTMYRRKFDERNTMIIDYFLFLFF